MRGSGAGWKPQTSHHRHGHRVVAALDAGQRKLITGGLAGKTVGVGEVLDLVRDPKLVSLRTSGERDEAPWHAFLGFLKLGENRPRRIGWEELCFGKVFKILLTSPHPS